jgi:hypothetical protein
MADRILRHVAVLVELYEKRGTVIALAVEPEPSCRLETMGETIEFFDRHLHSRPPLARGALAARCGGGDACATRRLSRCAVAVEFEGRTALRA